MNKKGFTLIELLTTICLMSLIGVSIGLIINKNLKEQKYESYLKYKEIIKSAVNLYVINNIGISNNLYINKQPITIKIKDVINEGYLNQNIINPITNEKISNNDEVKISVDDNGIIIVEIYE